ncbi:MAG: aldolase/citrate lyase family protein [Thaumarchaeota archaeon]|nr:aldolase/citrate lyase family protein [Nitrososphaerota archaeon]
MSALRKNTLRELLRNGKPTIGTHVASTWPGLIEVIGLTGKMDYVEFVSQYAPYDLYALENMARAADLHGLSTMIKIDAEPKTYLAQKSIAAGFQSVLFADLHSVREVEEAITAVRPEPKGVHGCFDNRAQGYGITASAKDYVQYYNDIVIAVMIEKKPLLDKLEDVMNLDGFDMVVFGGCDMSMSMGIPGQYDNPKLSEAREKVIKTAVKYDKHPRLELGGTAEDVRKGIEKYKKIGVTDIAIGTDYDIIHSYLVETGAVAAKLLGRK